MASFLAVPTYPVASSSTISRATAGQQKSFSIRVRPSFSGLKHVPKIKSPKAAKISSSRPRCLNATVPCSLLDQQKAKSDTLSILRSTIAKQLSIDASTVTRETKFADSLDTVEIMMSLKEQFGVSVGERGAESIATAQDATDLIEKVKAATA